MEHYKGKQKYSDIKPRCPLQSHTHWPGVETGAHGERPVTNRLEAWHGPVEEFTLNYT
jgi:hypothetical protein